MKAIAKYKSIEQRLTAEQRNLIFEWLRSKLSYRTIRRKAFGKWRLKLSEAWLSRQFRADTRPGKTVQQTHYVIEYVVRLKRNGEVLASTTHTLPLTGAAIRRPRALLRLAAVFS